MKSASNVPSSKMPNSHGMNRCFQFKPQVLFASICFAAVSILIPLVAYSKLPSETYSGSISWSPDGKNIVVGYRRHVAAILDAKSGDVILELDPHKKGAVDRRFTIKADTNMARDNWSPVAWSPNGKYVAVSHYMNVFIFDSKSGKLLKSRSSKRAKDFDPERQWNPILPGTDLTRLNDGWREVKSYVTGLQWNSKGNKLAISDANGVHVVDIDKGKELYTYEPMQHRTFAVSWTKDNSKLAAVSFNFSAGYKSLHIWDAKTGKTLKELKGIRHLAWSPDNQYLAYDKYRGIIIYDLKNDKIKNTITTSDEFPTFYWSPNGKYLAVSDQSEKIIIVNAATGTKVASYKQSKNKEFQDFFPSVFAWAPDGKSIAVGLEEYDIGFWKPNLNPEISHR